MQGRDNACQHCSHVRICTPQYSAHDALQDVCSLQKLITYSHVTIYIDMMCKYSISIECALDNYMYEKR